MHGMPQTQAKVFEGATDLLPVQEGSETMQLSHATILAGWPSRRPRLLDRARRLDNTDAFIWLHPASFLCLSSRKAQLLE